MRGAAIIILAVAALLLPGMVLAGPLSLYSPFDTTHCGVRCDHPLPSISAKEVLAGCGKGRYRDPQTSKCVGPADTRMIDAQN
jgi:hypothetical protein